MLCTDYMVTEEESSKVLLIFFSEDMKGHLANLTLSLITGSLKAYMLS